jgi:hypothetical protein
VNRIRERKEDPKALKNDPVVHGTASDDDIVVILSSRKTSPSDDGRVRESRARASRTSPLR